MSFGIDYVSGPSVAELKAAGVTFVCRYLSEVNALTQIKLLTSGEAKALSQGGIAIVSNFEWYAARATEGAASGVTDAQIAAAQHASCGGPADRPIYFSVDADVNGTQTAAYFKGVASSIGLHRTGAYGSYRVLKYLFDNNLITWGWQTYAWSGTLWEPRAHIQQYQNGVKLAGHDVDYDRSMHPDFGQWGVPPTAIGGHMTTIPQNWMDNGTTLVAPNGHKVVLGFRDHILNTTWDAGNVPLSEEYHATAVLLHNPALGDGQVQLCRDGMFWYTTAKGVVWEPYLGLEIQACYNALKAAQPPIPTPTPVDTTVVEADIHAIIDALPPLFAKLLVDVKKL
jgi:hypothetical protein